MSIFSKNDDYAVKAALRDASFYAAFLPIAVAIAPPHVRDWVQHNKEAFIPLTAWLITHGLVRKEVARGLAK